jgi:hypothetical protein
LHPTNLSIVEEPPPSTRNHSACIVMTALCLSMDKMELDSPADAIVLGRRNATLMHYTCRDECDVASYSDSYEPI